MHTFIHIHHTHTHTQHPHYKCEKPSAFLLFTLFVCNNSCNINTSVSIYTNSIISFFSFFLNISTVKKNNGLFYQSHWLSYYLSVKCEIWGKSSHFIVMIKFIINIFNCLTQCSTCFWLTATVISIRVIMFWSDNELSEIGLFACYRCSRMRANYSPTKSHVPPTRFQNPKQCSGRNKRFSGIIRFHGNRI